MSSQLILQTVVSGILVGGIYGLVALGLALAFGAGQGLQALLAGVSPRDGLTFAAAVAVAAVMAFLGSLLPALRAMRVDPITVMRSE